MVIKMNSENCIKSKIDLYEFLNIEKKYYPTNFLDYFLQISENAILKKHIILLRKAEYYTNTDKVFSKKVFYSLLSKHQNKYGIHIPLNSFGKGLHVMHVGPILVNGRARIGNYCSIHINTAIVAGGTSDGTPVIGNNAIIGIGAVVLGNVVLGNHIAIGANAVVNKSFPQDDVTIAGIPAKIIKTTGSTQWSRKTHSLSETKEYK